MSEKQVPTEFFLEAFSEGAGSIRGRCECCGRTCYASSESYFDKGELEELERKREKEPDKYIDFGDCSVSFGCVDGERFIYGCPCEMKSLYKYEAFVWSHRNSIIKYLIDVTKERKRRADENHAGATEVEKAVEGAFKREEEYGRQQECEAQVNRIDQLIESAHLKCFSICIEDKKIEEEIGDKFRELATEMRKVRDDLKKNVEE